jgi:hypothetical protein
MEYCFKTTFRLGLAARADRADHFIAECGESIGKSFAQNAGKTCQEDSGALLIITHDDTAFQGFEGTS